MYFTIYFIMKIWLYKFRHIRFRRDLGVAVFDGWEILVAIWQLTKILTDLGKTINFCKIYNLT